MKKSGFTLIELLIVISIIAILSGVLFIVIKPQAILGKARNARRWADVNGLATAVSTYTLDHDGNPPAGISEVEVQIGTCSSGGNVHCPSAANECVDLSSILALYVPNIPIDPSGDSSTTGYSVVVDENGFIHTKACLAEQGEDISLVK